VALPRDLVRLVLLLLGELAVEKAGKSPRIGRGSRPRSKPRIAVAPTSWSKECHSGGSSISPSAWSNAVRARQCQRRAVSRARSISSAGRRIASSSAVPTSRSASNGRS
jgi:hypothetical protein